MNSILSNFIDGVQIGISNQAVACGFQVTSGNNWQLSGILLRLKIARAVPLPAPLGPVDIRVFLFQGDLPPSNLTVSNLIQIDTVTLIDDTFRDYSATAHSIIALQGGSNYWIVVTASGLGAWWAWGGPFQAAGATPIGYQTLGPTNTWIPLNATPMITIGADLLVPQPPTNVRIVG